MPAAGSPGLWTCVDGLLNCLLQIFAGGGEYRGTKSWETALTGDLSALPQVSLWSPKRSGRRICFARKGKYLLLLLSIRKDVNETFARNGPEGFDMDAVESFISLNGWSSRF